MSFLQTEIPSPRHALTALRQRSTARAPNQRRSPRVNRVSGRSVVGLDIESGFLAAVETAPNSVVITRAAFSDLPPDVVREGEVVDPEVLGATLKAFFAEHNFSQRVRVGLTNQRTVMRTVDLPPITDERQLASAIRFQAQEHIAMPLDQAVLEHQTLGVVGTADGPRSRVVLVAARKEMVARLLRATQIAGLRLEGVDLSAFALVRALHTATDDPDTHLAYINVGSMTNLAVASGTHCLFTRVIPAGDSSMIAELSSRGGLTSEHARGWLRHVGLDQAPAQIEGDPRVVQATREVLERGVAQIAAEIRSTLDFYASQDSGRTAERAILTGAGTTLDGFADRFAQELGMPVEARTVRESPGVALEGIDLRQLTVAAGLTTTEAPK
jgi:type IV pilus assembly protein PilM